MQKRKEGDQDMASCWASKRKAKLYFGGDFSFYDNTFP